MGSLSSASESWSAEADDCLRGAGLPGGMWEPFPGAPGSSPSYSRPEFGSGDWGLQSMEGTPRLQSGLGSHAGCLGLHCLESPLCRPGGSSYSDYMCVSEGGTLRTDLDNLLGNESFCQWSSSPSPQVHAVSGSIARVPGLTPGPLSHQLSFLNTRARILVLGS